MIEQDCKVIHNDLAVTVKMNMVLCITCSMTVCFIHKAGVSDLGINMSCHKKLAFCSEFQLILYLPPPNNEP
jgi:hypothetical protein